MSILFPLARERFLSADLNWVTASTKIGLLTTTLDEGSIDNGTIVYVGDIPFSETIVIFRSELMADKTATDGYASSTEVEMSSFSSGSTPVLSMVIYEVGADDASSMLIAYIDGSPRFPLLGTGGGYTVIPDAAFGGYFRI